jgi:uncharacterized membrane protein YphA (DoxX/SURF4 family)
MNAKISLVIRFIVGAAMVAFGFNKIIPFMPEPEMAGDAATLMGIYGQSGFMSIIGILELVCGILLLVNKFVPLSLVILVAIMFNATLYHALHDPVNIAGALVFMVLCIVLVYVNRDRFKTMLSV